MAPSVLTKMPDAFAAGTTVKLNRQYADYPAGDGWAVKLYLAGASVLSVSGTPNSDGSFNFVLPSSGTKNLLPGNYQWKVIASKAGEDYIAEASTVRVDQNIAAAGAGDMQSADEKLLAVAEAVFYNRISRDQAEQYGIHGRQVSRMSNEALRKLIVSLRAKVRGENANGKIREVRVSFTGTRNET